MIWSVPDATKAHQRHNAIFSPLVSVLFGPLAFEVSARSWATSPFRLDFYNQLPHENCGINYL